MVSIFCYKKHPVLCTWHKNTLLIWYLLRGLAQGCTQLQHVSFTLTLLRMVPIGVVQCPTFIVVKGCAALYLLIFPASLQLSYICELQLSQFQLLLLSRGTTVLLGLFVITLFPMPNTDSSQFVHLTKSCLFFNALLRYHLYYKTFLVTSFSCHRP